MNGDAEGVEFGLCDVAVARGDEKDLVGGEGLQCALYRLNRVRVA